MSLNQVIKAIGFVAIACFGQVALADAIPYTDKSKVNLGQSIYEQNCASCHGRNLEGQFNWQKRSADGYLPAPPHDETGHTWHHPDQMLFEFTKYGPQNAGAEITGFKDWGKIRLCGQHRHEPARRNPQSSSATGRQPLCDLGSKRRLPPG